MAYYIKLCHCYSILNPERNRVRGNCTFHSLVSSDAQHMEEEQQELKGVPKNANCCSVTK